MMEEQEKQEQKQSLWDWLFNENGENDFSHWPATATPQERHFLRVIHTDASTWTWDVLFSLPWFALQEPGVCLLMALILGFEGAEAILYYNWLIPQWDSIAVTRGRARKKLVAQGVIVGILLALVIAVFVAVISWAGMSIDLVTPLERLL